MNSGKMCTRVMLIWVLMVVISMSVISLVDAQVLPPCADQILLPCIDYVNSTQPPDICCNPIKDLYATHKTCFCQLIAAYGLFEAFGLKITQVFQVIYLCGINFNTSSCIGMWNENIFNTSSVLNRLTHWRRKKIWFLEDITFLFSNSTI